ncbi:glycosyltransferase family 4 protein [candidate division WWE3 bacterium]|uniref:Glycosyltransferase family 4 protein n=1 Tax=candidate division WWE3 bacterium TaxID=2053526 RepID=A0A7X9E6R4_UNCKA|nr:glycosyltransferase family 4 protein [candidate division WWE3 bacterium]
MNILFINRWVGYNEGGNETHIKDLMYQFSKKGHIITVITTQGDSLDYLKDKINIEYVSGIHGYYSYRFLGFLYAFVFNLKCFVKFIELNKKLRRKGERFDVLSVHFSLEAFLARFIKLFFGVPYVLVLAGDTLFELIEGKRADGKVAISNFMNDQCKKYGYSAEIIPKGIDLSRFNPNVDCKDLFDENKLSGKVLILTVCRLDPRKDLITLVECANEIINKKKRRDFMFLIIGEGVERRRLEEKIENYGLKDNVKLIGKVLNSSNELPKYYVMSNLFVLPTLYEGFGWVYIEAMASGLPIVTTKVGSNEEVVGDIGVLIKPRDHVLLADTVLKILDDKENIEKMRKSGLEKVKAYSWDNIMFNYEGYYLSVSSKKCDSLSCKLFVLLSIFTDIIFVALKSFVNLFISRKRRYVGSWSGVGQEGMNK